MTFRELFEVFFSPVEAFKKILEKPDYKGPILVLVLTLLLTAGTQYINASKVLLEPFALDNTLIPASGPPYNLTLDPVNLDSPRKISVFTYNWTSGSDNVTIYGKNAQGEDDLELLRIEENNTAYNTTKYFTKMTEIQFSKAGDNSSQYIMLGMNVPMEEYESVLTKGVLGGVLSQSLISRAFDFFINWGIYAILLYVVIKVFREEVGSLGELFIVVGYAFVVTLIYSLVSIPLISMLPQVGLPLQAWNVPQEATQATKNIANDLLRQIYQESWYSRWTYQVVGFLFYAFDAWVVALFIIAIRFACEISWKKAAAISIIAYGIRFVLRLFLGI